jgi:hypothetical protein
LDSWLDLGYSPTVKARRTTVFLGLFWLMMAIAGWAQSHDDFCRENQAPPQLSCPRTSARTCHCYLSTRTNPGENPPAWPRQAVVPRLRRPSRPLLRKLPQCEPPALASSFRPPVPTPPPRGVRGSHD